MTNTTTTTNALKTFPLQKLELVLTDELLQAVETEADMMGIPMPKQQAQAVSAPVPIDSLVAVEIICAIEPIIGFSPSDATVRAGGYASVEDALKHLLPRLEHQWLKKQGGAK